MQNVSAQLCPRADEVDDPIRVDFSQGLKDGLRSVPKSIPSRFFYDARGSDLFEQITQLAEYYPTRTETEILSRHGAELVGDVQDTGALIEFGSGSSTKTEILLRFIPPTSTYIPIDVSATALNEAKSRLVKSFPHLHIEPRVADFSEPLKLPGSIRCKSKLGFFPGSTIGNFRPNAATELLRAFSSTLGPKSQLIIGVDLKKDPKTLNRAYNDALGITAKFNLNLLRRANEALGANFDLTAFEHRAAYDPETGGVDMYLVSQKMQSVQFDGFATHLGENEAIHTEHSHKYDIDDFVSVANAGGWHTHRIWKDENEMFAVFKFQN
ncbi:MAG: L-histidine N(alpha)-methyltransferase [Alphaproteobacteria bacterium]|nr:L-histidine N(alpha)-methyltransferase [Alphaproteobacteria bacterium]